MSEGSQPGERLDLGAPAPAQTDPVTLIGQRQKELRLPLKDWLRPFAAIGSVAGLFFGLSICLDLLLGGSDFTGHGLKEALLAVEPDQARNTLGSLGEIMAAVLGLALTVSSIIVQLAATRFTPIVTSLFFRDRTNQLVLSFFVVCNIYVLWINFVVGPESVPSYGVLVSMLLMTASLLLLFPYFSFVFNFLEPDSIISRITTDGLAASTPYRGRGRRSIGGRQREATQGVEHLANIGLNAVQQKDKNIASSATNALCNYAIYYGDTKAGMIHAWHSIPDWNRQSPDFVSLSDEAVDDLRNRGTWLEWKILRQYQMLYGEGLERMKDLCYLIAINTRRLGEAAARHGDLPALDLAIKFFNTYLRATINANDIRTCYNILHQYRQLGEFVIEHTDTNPEDLILDQPLSMTSTLTVTIGAPAGDLSELERRGLEIARYMRYYSGIAFSRNMAFITEVIAHDVGALCARAFHADTQFHDELLATFLRVDDSTETETSDTTLQGVRRAQVKLATIYMLHGAESLARRIQADMKNEPAERMRGIWQHLSALRTREFWEVNDRGSNFDYLSDEQKGQLPVFFSWFPALNKDALTALRNGKTEPPGASKLVTTAP
ncbi:hypothetical protein ENSA5_52560 [Enhygromyxa salina]|uniref:DUF2254 domain-containing protein n=1 Tax=Enhygromyxa salina TaxID=215803 RepID=A0A2S9XG22_9BACT|nr:DUF2254 family protein [Enhygromyxa salina]PRP91819.1 hypothetical protein ENSA5_52560 [Enhygromyxa salina]